MKKEINPSLKTFKEILSLLDGESILSTNRRIVEDKIKILYHTSRDLEQKVFSLEKRISLLESTNSMFSERIKEKENEFLNNSLLSEKECLVLLTKCYKMLVKARYPDIRNQDLITSLLEEIKNSKLLKA